MTPSETSRERRRAHVAALLGLMAVGAATVKSSASSMTVNQSTQDVVIDWLTFGIGTNESVRFNQPNSSSIALNRVLGESPSQILGTLSANGQVFILNPNGVLFGKGAQVNVGGIVASTLGMSDEERPAVSPIKRRSSLTRVVTSPSSRRRCVMTAPSMRPRAPWRWRPARASRSHSSAVAYLASASIREH
jgi:filamentous hemagglutinin family protein